SIGRQCGPLRRTASELLTPWKRVEPASGAATKNDPAGSFSVARFRLTDFPGERVRPSAGSGALSLRPPIWITSRADSSKWAGTPYLSNEAPRQTDQSPGETS